MSKSGARYPEPLDTVVREMAGDFNVDRYTLETYVMLTFVLDVAPSVAIDSERAKLGKLRLKLQWSHPSLPALLIGVQQELEPSD
jgi:hypothetical protein